MKGTEAEMKPKLWFSMLPLFAAAAAMAGVYAYYRFVELESPGRVATETVSPVTTGSPGIVTLTRNSSGFKFSTYDEPRPLPRVDFTDGAWRELTLETFLGKVVLLNIWATWCVPCREEMPTLDRLQAKLGGSDFHVVALSIDLEGIFAVKDFYEELNLKSLEIYADDRMSAPSSLGVIGIPATLLIDREGREIGRMLGPAEWDSDDVIAEIRRYLDV
jgi:thiol-disulfide isomerase/thioredoxin